MNTRQPSSCLSLSVARLGLALPLLFVAGNASAETVVIWLDDLDLSGMQQDFDKPHARLSVQGNALKVGGRAFARGIGCHATSRLTLDIQGKATRFQALVGVDDGRKTHPGSAGFIVSGDRKVLWQSGVMRSGQTAKPVDVDLSGLTRLELQVTDGGDGTDSDHADWLDARLSATAPLDHLLPPERRSADAWNRLSDVQTKRGVGVEVAAPGVWRVRLGQPEALTPRHFQEQPPTIDRIAGLATVSRSPIKLSGIGFRTNGRGCALELPLEPGEELYGLGMNLRVFRLNGGKKTVRVSDDQTKELGDSHAPVPFYVSTRGYGVYVDTARYASFYFGNLDAVGVAAGTTASGGGNKPAISTEDLYRQRDPSSMSRFGPGAATTRSGAVWSPTSPPGRVGSCSLTITTSHS